QPVRIGAKTRGDELETRPYMSGLERRPLSTMLQVSQDKDIYFSDFERLDQDAAARGSVWVRPLRPAAIGHFAKQPFPTARDEEWRFTNVAPILKIPFRPAYEYALNGLSAARIAPFIVGEPRGHRMAFVDGLFSKELSEGAPAPDRARFVNLAQ